MRPFHVAAIAAIAVVGFAAYSNSFGAEFTYDDYDVIVENPHNRWTELSFENLLRSATGSRVRRPVAHMSFGLNHYFGGYEVTGYHAVNLAIHLLNGLLVYALALDVFRRLRGLPGQWNPDLDARAAGWMALCAALLFVAHPLQVQSVTYVVQRMNSLATGFYIGALLLYLRGRDAAHARRRTALWVASFASWILALGSKENAVTLPFAIWLYEGWLLADLSRDWIRRRLPLAAAAAVCGLALLWLHTNGFQGYAVRSFTLPERLLTQGRVVCLYIGLILLPLPSRLSLIHDLETSRSLLDPPATLAALLLLLGLVVFALGAARRWRLASFGILWFFLHLALESSFLPLLMVFEHRTYLPLVGVCIPAAYALFSPLARRRVVALAVASLLVAALGAATWARNETWRRQETLWADAFRKSPDHPATRMKAGDALVAAGRLEDALVHYREAIRIDPRFVSVRLNAAATLAALGRTEEALEQVRDAIAVDPDHAVARVHYARLLARAGRLEEAAAQLERAIARRPDEGSVEALGEIRALQGRSAEALRLHLRAAAMNPRRAAPRVAAGTLLVEAGRFDEAAAQFAAALRTRPGDAEIHALRGDALWQARRFAEAIAELEAAVRLQPEWPVAVNNLAWMLATCEDEALRDAEHSLDLALDLADGVGARDAGVVDTLAAAYAASGRFEEAIAAASRAARLAEASGDPSGAEQIRARAALYAARRSYVDAIPAAPSAAHPRAP
jgi:tetratricopeptide (TPR) repeat protein